MLPCCHDILGDMPGAGVAAGVAGVAAGVVVVPFDDKYSTVEKNSGILIDLLLLLLMIMMMLLLSILQTHCRQVWNTHHWRLMMLTQVAMHAYFSLVVVVVVVDRHQAKLMMVAPWLC